MLINKSRYLILCAWHECSKSKIEKSNDLKIFESKKGPKQNSQKLAKVTYAWRRRTLVFIIINLLQKKGVDLVGLRDINFSSS
jgi:hypothetical protein